MIGDKKSLLKQDEIQEVNLSCIEKATYFRALFQRS